MSDWILAKAEYTAAVQRLAGIALLFFAAAACGGDDTKGDAVDAASTAEADASSASPDASASAVDAGISLVDAQPSAPDAASSERTTLSPQLCPSTPTAPGLYEGTLASNLNDVSGCGGLSAPGRDGAVRLELAPGASVAATLRHDGDGILYILDACPVVSSCLDSSDGSISGAESVSYTNDTGVTNIVYVILDSDSLGGAQTFELDLSVAN